MDEEQSDSPPSLINGSSVDTDSICSSLGRKTDAEELGEQSTITAAAAAAGSTPLLTITLPQLRGALISSMSSVAAVTCSQLKLPMTRNSMRKQTSSVDSSRVTPAAVSAQATAAAAPPTLADGEASKLPTSPLSPQPLSKPLVASDSKMNDKPAPADISQPSTASAVEQLQQQSQQDQQKPLIESSTCTEEEDNEDDVIEIGEIESELDISAGGGEGEGEGEEKGTSISADTLSSDDEWDESLLPPRYLRVTLVK